MVNGRNCPRKKGGFCSHPILKMHTKTRVYNLIIYVLLCKYAQNERAIQVWHSAHAISTQHHAVHTAVVWVEKKQKKTNPTQNAEPHTRARIIHGMSKYGNLL